MDSDPIEISREVLPNIALIGVGRLAGSRCVADFALWG